MLLYPSWSVQKKIDEKDEQNESHYEGKYEKPHSKESRDEADFAFPSAAAKKAGGCLQHRHAMAIKVIFILK